MQHSTEHTPPPVRIIEIQTIDQLLSSNKQSLLHGLISSVFGNFNLTDRASANLITRASGQCDL